MSAGYIRRWTSEQAAATYLNIESVNIVDLEPPATFAGVPFGRACLVAEFEDGPFNTPTLISDSDLGEGATFGGFGFTYAGVRYNYCSAVSRKADSAVTPEYWNGNGFVQLQGKKFSSLVLSRVDTSQGQVQFTRAAYINGASKARFGLATGQTLIFNFGGTDSTATFNGVPATVTGSAAAFANIVAGDTAVFSYDAAPQFTVTFLSGDTTVANVVARINQYAGFTFAANAAGQVSLTGIQGGTGGLVAIYATGSTALTKLGLVAGNTSGTGNVVNIAAVTPTELNTIVTAANAKAAISVLQDGRIRMTNIADGAAGILMIRSNGTAVSALGFSPLDANVTAASGNNGIIPAGTRVQVPAGQTYVTMQTISVVNTNAGPYSVKVRSATDDGSGGNAAVSTVNTLIAPVEVDAYTVTNQLPIGAALTESQIDAAYTAAIQATEDINSDAKQVNVIWAARQSNSVRRALLADALAASSSGLFGRSAVVRAPIGITKTVAMGAVEPGVQPYRNERLLYCWPQASIIMEAIQQRGVAGGNGFTANGLISIGADGFLASSISLLPAGENPAQDAGLLKAVVDLDQMATQTALTIQDYIAFKAAGIVALRMDAGQATFQSGVTSVDPTVDSARVDIERRTLADFIEDSMAALAAPYIKKKMTAARKAALLDAWKNFLNPLLGDADGNNQVLDSYSLIPKPTPTSLAQGRYRVIFKGKSVPSFKSIELAAMVGPGVVIDEQI